MLTDKQIQGLRPQSKPYRVTDANSLIVEVSTAGARAFRLRYRIRVGADVKARILTLGTYPDISLRDAREKAAEARALIAKGVDPSQKRRASVQAAAADVAATFDAVFDLLAAEKQAKRKEPDGRPQQTFINTAEKYLMPRLRGVSLADITSTGLHEIIGKVYKRIPGTGATLVRMVNEIYQLADRRGIYTGRNPARFLNKDFPRPESVSQPSVRDCIGLAKVLADIDTLSTIPRLFLRLVALTFARSIELRTAEWSEFDLDAALWTVPAGRMKKNREHLVPLSRQAVALLRELHKITERTGVLFPALQSGKSRFMSECHYRKALGVQLGYAGEHTAHGFRGTATTTLKECRFDRDAIFLSIAHWSKAKGDSADATYDSAALLPYRRTMMQGYADYLDGLVTGDPNALMKLKAVRVLLRDSLD